MKFSNNELFEIVVELPLEDFLEENFSDEDSKEE